MVFDNLTSRANQEFGKKWLFSIILFLADLFYFLLNGYRSNGDLVQLNNSKLLLFFI